MAILINYYPIQPSLHFRKVYFIKRKKSVFRSEIGTVPEAERKRETCQVTGHDVQYTCRGVGKELTCGYRTTVRFRIVESGETYESEVSGSGYPPDGEQYACWIRLSSSGQLDVSMTDPRETALGYLISAVACSIIAACFITFFLQSLRSRDTQLS